MDEPTREATIEQPPGGGTRARSERAVRRAARRVAEPVAEHLVEPIHEHVVAPVADHIVEPATEHVIEPVVGRVEPVVGRVAGAVGSVLRVADRMVTGPDASRARRLRRRNRRPLANLYDVHPEARLATPREIGLRFVPLEEILGTAVAGAAQRGGDFLPLKPFRGQNWQTRWARIQRANNDLVTLPPIDVVRYGGGYWVIDGHNRVAAALYANGVGLDAMVTELVPLEGRLSEPPTALLPLLPEASQLRAAMAATDSDRGGHEDAAVDERDGSAPGPEAEG